MSEYPISASQYKTAFDLETGCLRKWAFYKIDGIVSESTAPQMLGTNVHTDAENYLRDGTVPDLKTKHGRIFASGMHLLPPRASVTGVEQEFKLRFNSDLTYYGLIDFMGDDFVGDHKTTSNLRYMLKPDELERDPQGVIYGMHLATTRKMGLTDKLNLKWVYYLTRGAPEARSLDVTTTRIQLERTYFPMSENATKLVQLRRTAERALDVEPNYKACGAYGGCPHISKCEKQPVYFGINTNNTEEGSDSMSSLLDTLKARSQKRAPQPKPEPAPEAPAAEVVSINPPQAEPESQTETEPVDNGPSDEQIDEEIIEQKVEAFYEEPKPKAATKTRGRGRPKGSKNKPKPTAKVKEVAKLVVSKAESQIETQPALVACADVPEETSTVDQPCAPAVAEGYTLYINCLPSSGGEDITKRLREIATQCATDNSVEDYRFIRFGEGPARFSKSVTAALQTEPLRGKIVVESSNLMIKDCIEVLIENATEVVRAIR